MTPNLHPRTSTDPAVTPEPTTVAPTGTTSWLAAHWYLLCLAGGALSVPAGLVDTWHVKAWLFAASFACWSAAVVVLNLKGSRR